MKVFPTPISLLASSLALTILPCQAGDDLTVTATLRAADEEAFVPNLDILRARYEWQDTMDFDDSNAELDHSDYSVASFLSKPINLFGDWNLVPYADYTFTELDFDKLASGSLFEDQDLHDASLHGMLYHKANGSPWIYGAWGRVSFASDGEDVGSDDFYYDVALGAAYVFSDKLVLGLGLAGLELGRDESFIPGPLVYWKVTDTLDFAIMGPLLITTWEANDSWTLALRGSPVGNSWNVDSNGNSLEYDLGGYAIRLHTEHRIFNDLWLSLGVGYTFGSEFEVRNSSGNRIFKDDLDGGLTASVALRLRSW